MEWCIKNDKIETLTMEYTWNGMECAWNVHGVFHMEWCINCDKIELIPHLSCFNKKSCDSIYTY